MLNVLLSSRALAVFAAASGLLFLLNGCKYEEGPFITFLTAKERLVRSWKYTEVKRNGASIMDGTTLGSIVYRQSNIGFDRDGRFSSIIAYKGASGTETYDGSWELYDSERYLVLNYDDPLVKDDTLKFFNLTEKIMHVRNAIGGNAFDYALSSK